MPDVSPSDNPLHDFIVSAVQSAWDDPIAGPHKAMLLSTLGTKLRNKFGDYSADFPNGIKEFLRTWPLVQIVQHPDIKEKIGLIPAGKPLPNDVTSLFRKAGERHVPTYSTPYDQDFWNAFVKPIQSTRYVVIGERGQVHILNDADQVPPGAYEIAESDILSPDHSVPLAEKVEGTRDRINKWLAKNSLNAAQFLRKRVSGTASSQDRLVSLKQAFEKISDEDRARVLIPLDIILKIIS